MSVNVKLSENLVEQAKHHAQIQHRSAPKQIEYWSQIGKIAEENPDLPFSMIRDLSRCEGLQVSPLEPVVPAGLYRIIDEDNLKLLTFGPHENFYRDLKRAMNDR
ncbi:MAG: hypothetical protein Q7U66_10590 [Methylobacter sp.]|nr:hypothetical protein [Methylobacter sp.]